MARKKKKKLNVRKLSIIICLLLVLTTIILNITNIKTLYISKKTGYNKETVTVFMELDIYNQVKEHKYSKTLEKILNTEYYNESYIQDYLEIEYIEDDSFLKNISILLDKGYKSNDINTIYEKLSNDSINILIEYDYIEDITNILSFNYFRESNLERYIKYKFEFDYDIETILTYVNIGLDNNYYTNVSNIENESDKTVLVNKYYKLSKDYVPSNLQNVSYGSGKLTQEAKIAFDLMCEGAKKDKINIYGGSGYRSYSYQENLYNRYVKQDGKTEADTYSARAGHSEHQTGLAMDILNGKWEYISENDKEYTWLINNSYKYGFILRYPKGKEKVTGYMYEEWHYRYIGIDLATELTKSGLTYEEYIAKNS